jgi:hypothetical protein
VFCQLRRQFYSSRFGADGLVGGVGCAHIANDCTTHLSEYVRMHVSIATQLLVIGRIVSS